MTQEIVRIQDKHGTEVVQVRVFDGAGEIAMRAEGRMHYYISGGEQAEKARGRLAALEETILGLVRQEETLRFRIARLLMTIREEQLYRATGFETFGAYLDYTLEEWRRRGLVQAASRRQVYDWIRIESIFVQQLGLDEAEVVGLGLTNFTKLAEALSIDRATGKIIDLTPEEYTAQRKLPPGEVLQIVDAIRENRDQWTVGDTVQVVNMARGITSRAVKAYWELRNGRYYLRDLQVYEGDTGASALRGGLTESQMLHVCKRLGINPAIDQAE